MGLDVYAYKNVKPIGDADTDSDEVSADFRVCYADPKFFAGRCDEWPDGTPLAAEDFMDGYSGGYGGYCAWREELAELGGHPRTEGLSLFGSIDYTYSHGAEAAGCGPFWELIWFPDCEGTLGTAVCKKLAADFIEFEAKANQIGGRFLDIYNQFKDCFEFASENGAVNFR